MGLRDLVVLVVHLVQVVLQEHLQDPQAQVVQLGVVLVGRLALLVHLDQVDLQAPLVLVMSADQAGHQDHLVRLVLEVQQGQADQVALQEQVVLQGQVGPQDLQVVVAHLGLRDLLEVQVPLVLAVRKVVQAPVDPLDQQVL